MKYFFIVLCVMIGLSACSSSLIPNNSTPVIERSSGDTGLLATTGSRRVVIVKRRDNRLFGSNSKGGDQFCAEPSPDTITNIFSSLTTSADVNIHNSLGEKESQSSIKANLAKKFLNTNSRLFLRTQGIQFFRDGLYNLCQAHLNNAIDSKGYQALYVTLLEASLNMVNNEIGKSLQDQPAMHTSPSIIESSAQIPTTTLPVPESG